MEAWAGADDGSAGLASPLGGGAAAALDIVLDGDFSAPVSRGPAGSAVALPVGHQLFEYTIEALLGTGGFGQTYLARDNHLECQVAIKEYLPGDLALRVEGQTVCPRSREGSPDYAAGLRRFLKEARTLASFRHPNIVRVTRFFEANGTAYMVMEYERGQSLREWRRSRPRVAEDELLRMFLPLLEGLEVVHGARVTHRDIKPANIYVRETDGSLVLLDFGSARQTEEVGTRGVTTIVTPGYAPFEQYHSKGILGPWTDIYALGGVLYWLVTGEKPLESPARLKEDTMVPAQAAAGEGFSPAFLAAVDWALQSDEKDRPRSVADFRLALTGQQPVPARALSEAAAKATAAPAAAPAPRRRGLLLAAGGTLLGLAAAGLALQYFRSRPEAPPPPPSVPAISPVSAPAPEPERAPEKRDLPVPEKRRAANKAVEPAPPPSRRREPARSAGATARLAFRIQPQGEIYLDGKRVGLSPPLMEIPLPAGRHAVEVRGDAMPYVGYHTVDLKAGETRQIRQQFGNN